MRLPSAALTAALLWTLVYPISTAARASNELARENPTLTVTGTNHDLAETPVIIDLDSKKLDPGRYLLQPSTGGPALPALVYRDQEQACLGVILPEVAAQATLQFAIEPDLGQRESGRGVRLISQARRVAVTTDGQAWTTYIPDDGPKPFLDPLFGPTNLPLTRAWPMREVAGEPHDHPHHRSLWFAHFDVNKTDTWDENPGHGQIRETSRPTVVGDGPVGVLRTTNDWLDRNGGKICEDERVVTFYATTSARVLDFAVTLKATNGPIKIGDNKDGVFAVRVAGPMAVTAKQGGHIVNSRGLQDKAAWGQPAEWVDYTGPIGGETMGIAILNHPSSFRFPTTWHVRDYGLFAANPFGWHDFGQDQSGEHAIEAGGSIRLAYRVVLHRGTTEQAAIAHLYRSFANPPQLTLR